METTPKFESSLVAGNGDDLGDDEVREVTEEELERKKEVLKKEDEEKKRIAQENWDRNLDELKVLGKKDALFDHLVKWHEGHPLAMNTETDAHEVARNTAKENRASSETPQEDVKEDDEEGVDGEEDSEETNAMFSEFTKPAR